ncbi:hypothetical protein KPL71_004227 [Citrus sinensis]|uniref:Uncharacterized protein n=1 Tax=Citrus sinensis TaxID=2711 RepID=A0ACB8N3G0_CITSI|nr:hypothetical protein KPL71_004227 [Citrus sinensis]
MATKTEEPSTSTLVVDESSDDNNDDQGSQTEPVPPVPPVSENSSKPSSSPWFTFDDIPRHKWQGRHQEFAAWIDVQMTKPHAQTQNVLHEFCSRFTGSLRDWFESLGEYIQLQLIQTTIATTLLVIYEQFIGEPVVSTKASRKEYHQMKCCSLKRHHLEMHCKRMSMLYYKLNGFNDPSLKHVFAASLPPELQPELQRQLTAFNLDIANVSLGKIFQLTMLCLDKICEQKDFFKDLIEHKEPFASACKKPYLKIQCKDDKKCTCLTSKKKHFQKHLHRSSSKKSKKPYRYFRKKDSSQFRKKKHNRCFICNKRGHFARNCPNKSTKIQLLLIPPFPKSSLNFVLKITHSLLPLWKNEQFFIHLSFKLNKDVNPTKATHPGMPPTDLSLTKQECTQLLQQGLIEPTPSDWACQAFYVEKWSELVRGKKRLVIDYQPLNAFLKDDKFPLPKIQSLFIHLQGTKVFSRCNLAFHQKTVPKQPYVSLMLIISRQSYPSILKLLPLYFKKQWLRSFPQFSIML